MRALADSFRRGLPPRLRSVLTPSRQRSEHHSPASPRRVQRTAPRGFPHSSHAAVIQIPCCSRSCSLCAFVSLMPAFQKQVFLPDPESPAVGASFHLLARRPNRVFATLIASIVSSEWLCNSASLVLPFSSCSCSAWKS